MPTVLFICTANRFRSCLASAYFQKLLADNGGRRNWIVGNAGTWVKEETTAHPAALQIAKNHGLDLSAHRTQEVTQSILETADLVLVMEEGQKEALQFEFTRQRRKIYHITQFAPEESGDIPDPAKEGFEHAEQDAACLFHVLDIAFPHILRYFEDSNRLPTAHYTPS